MSARYVNIPFRAEADISACPRDAKPELPLSNAAHSETHIRRRNRKCSDGTVAVLRSLAAVIRALPT
jgi:hypothetical protein